jgi:hypothetical protein
MTAMTELSPDKQAMLDAYHLAERSFWEAERLYVKGDLPLSDWRQTDSSAQAAYDLCIEAGFDPFTT